jgi:hypothetical protein
MPEMPMHERMTRPTQPRHVPQLLFCVPAALDGFIVHHSRYKMVVRQRDVFSLADLAPVCQVFGLGWRRRGCGEG